MKTKNFLRFSIVLSVIPLVLAGCASTRGGGGPSDEEVLQSMAAEMLEALKAKDVETMVSFYADDFTSDNGGKDDTKAFLEGAAQQGFLDGLEVDTSEMAVAVEGDTATIGPIKLEGAFGALTMGFDMEKRDGKWWVVAQTQEM